MSIDRQQKQNDAVGEERRQEPIVQQRRDASFSPGGFIN